MLLIVFSEFSVFNIFDDGKELKFLVNSQRFSINETSSKVNFITEFLFVSLFYSKEKLSLNAIWHFQFLKNKNHGRTAMFSVKGVSKFFIEHTTNDFHLIFENIKSCRLTLMEKVKRPLSCLIFEFVIVLNA